MWREKVYLWRGEHEVCTQLTEALSTWDLYSCLSMTLKNGRSSYLRRAPVTPTVGVHALLLNHVWLCATLWTVARQAPLSMGFSRKEYWSGLPFPSPGDLPSPGTEPVSCIGRQILHHWAIWGACDSHWPSPKWGEILMQSHDPPSMHKWDDSLGFQSTAMPSHSEVSRGHASACVLRLTTWLLDGELGFFSSVTILIINSL